MPAWKLACYGMPHFMAEYTADDTDKYRRAEGAICVVCGRPATDVHHVPPKSTARSVVMETPAGKFVLKPALMAMCRECHEAYHRGLVRVRWEWDEGQRELWESGWLLAHRGFAHGGWLYGHGRWVFWDERTKSAFQFRARPHAAPETFGRGIGCTKEREGESRMAATDRFGGAAAWDVYCAQKEAEYEAMIDNATCLGCACCVECDVAGHEGLGYCVEEAIWVTADDTPRSVGCEGYSC